MSADTAELPILEFVTPMPGFPGQRRFVLVRVDDDGLLYALRSVDDPELRFLVIAPARFFPDYEPEIDDETLDLLGLEDPAEALVLLVVNAGETAAGATANLLAPILVHHPNRRAAQVVLAGSDLPIRAPLAVH